MKKSKNLLLTLALFAFMCNVNGQLIMPDYKVFISNETTINSEQLEYSPAFYEDGIVFISTNPASSRYKVKDKRIDKNIMSIYLAKRGENGALQNPDPFAKELLSTLHEGPLTFDRTGEFLFFTRNNQKDGKQRRSKDGISKLKIYSTVKIGKAWSKIKELPFNDNESNTAHPSVSVEGDKLYFASDREGGLGGMDIYVSHRKGDDWGDPVNLGPKINTPSDEIFPFIHADGTLYFASTGLPGLGGLDIFYVQSEGDMWGKPQNLGKPFNTEQDDFGIIIDRDRKNGYFSSNRPGGKGQDDIYSFFVTGQANAPVSTTSETPDIEKQIWVTVLDQASATEMEGANVVSMNLNELDETNVITSDNGDLALLQSTGEANELVLKIAAAGENGSGVTDMQGRIPLTIRGGNSVINISKEGYQTKQIVVDSNSPETDYVAILEKATSCIPFKGRLMDQTSNPPIAGAKVTIIDDDNVETEILTTDLSGKFDYCLKRNKLYNIKIEKGSLNTSKQISTINSMGGTGLPMTSTFEVNGGGTVSSSSTTTSSSPLAIGTVIQLPNIYYNFNDASIRPDAARSLDALVSILNQYPDVGIEIASHTDSRGRSSYNKRLSQKRADNAINYLIKRGISSSRVSAVGYGEELLRNTCDDGVRCSDEDHQFNRRTEVRVIAVDGRIVASSPNSGGLLNPSTSRPSSSSSSTTGRSSSVSSDRAGTYCVIAGTYRGKDNAIEKLTQLQDLGYGNVSIIKNESKMYHYVCVDRFSNQGDAAFLMDELKSNHQIKAFVKKVDSQSTRL